LKSYDKTERTNNGLAVVIVKVVLAVVVFQHVPPQRQADIVKRKNYVCWSICGRILAGVEDEITPRTPVKKKKNQQKLNS